MAQRLQVNDRLRKVVDLLRGPTQYQHDALGNLAAAAYADGRVDLRMPDAVGNLFRTRERTDRKYGPAGQLLEARDADGSVTRYAYDPEGNLTKKARWDVEAARRLPSEGIAPENTAREVWTYEWNGAGMLSKVVRPDGAPVEFTYDALGRRLSKTHRHRKTRWLWDGNVSLHEWVEVIAPQSAESAAPPPSTIADEIAATHRRATLNDRPAQGPPAPVSAATSAGATPTSSLHSAFASPASAASPASSAPEFLAPPLSVGRQAPPSPPSASAGIESGTAESPITWLFEPESFAPLAKLVAGSQYGIVTDHLGTPQAMFDATGAEVWSASIDAYGDLRNLKGPRQACPFRFPGQYEDEETGLYYNRFRYYDRDSGAYTSQDPLRLSGGAKLYSYVGDPLTWSDVVGLTGACVPPDVELNEISRKNARRLLQERGLTPKQAAEIVNSFQGQVYVSKGKAGDVFVITESKPGPRLAYS